MKRYVVIVIMCVTFQLFTLNIDGQVAINQDGSLPDNSAMVDVKSINKGILIPRLCNNDRNQMPSPAYGLIIFNTTLHRFNYYDGATWCSLDSYFISTETGVIRSGGGLSISSQPNGQPDASAMLDLIDTSRGLLIPRTDPSLITSPAVGLLIFNTTLNRLACYTQHGWIMLCSVSLGVPGSGGNQGSIGVAIKDEDGNPDPSAILDVSATDKGFLIPRLNTLQRNDILPVEGLTIFNTTSEAVEFYDGNGWYRIQSTSVASPTAGTHISFSRQIVWNWSSVEGATGYKWNIVNDYSTSVDIGDVNSKIDTGLNCSTCYQRYLWAYNSCGNSNPDTLIQSTTDTIDFGELFSDRMAVWTNPEETTDEYFINRIGDQDRQATFEEGVRGVLHPGRAIQYDGAKSQYSVMIGSSSPNNFRLANNSLTFSFWVKLDEAPGSGKCGHLFGVDPGAGSGRFYSLINSNRTITFTLRYTGGATYVNVNTSALTIGEWYHIAIVIDKTSNYKIYVNNQPISSVNISCYSFSDVPNLFYIGGRSSYHAGRKSMRDIRVFPTALSPVQVSDLCKQKFVPGANAWWMGEEGKESNCMALKDCVGSNHLLNMGFDSNSLINGSWLSLLNQHGYSVNPLAEFDLLEGRGDFSSTTYWSKDDPTNFWISGGKLVYSGAVSSGLKCWYYKGCAPFTGTTIGATYRIRFKVSGASTAATMAIIRNSGGNIIVPSASYGNGCHDVYFTAQIGNITAIGFNATTDVAFNIDDVSFSRIDTGIILPRMQFAIPSEDLLSRALTFKGQAKYHLFKADEETVKLPDSIAEIVAATNLITVNDWYANNGVGAEMVFSAIDPYQTKRQYYNNGELIIMKADAVLTNAEDSLIKSRLNIINEPYQYMIDVAKGALSGTSAEIYGTTQAIVNGEPASTLQSVAPTESDLDPTKNYISMAWADFFPTDVAYTLPLVAKYNPLGFSNTFQRQIKPKTDDVLNSIEYRREDLMKIEGAGSWDGEHGLFLHIPFLTSMPLYDGRTTPSNDDLRIDRGNGTNAWGHNIQLSVDASISESIRSTWLRLSPAIGATLWQDLSDTDCDAIRKSMSLFAMTTDPQNGQKVLESLDILSERYCGTIGRSVSDDYITRTPNFIDGVMAGGIFQGATSTCNHEIWERVLVITEAYKREFEGKIKEDLFIGSCGGSSQYLFYNEGRYITSVCYTDRNRTLLSTGVTKYTSSITGVSRSLIDIARSFGFITSVFAQGDQYGQSYWDGTSRLEAQRTFKKSGIKKIDNLGDGYYKDLRLWDTSIPLSDHTNLLGSEDVVKTLYDYTYGTPRYSSIDEYSYNCGFHKILDIVTKFNAWGITPGFIGDSQPYPRNDTAKNASWTLVLEAFFQFCKRAGITVLSFEQACLMGQTKTMPAGYNYFPNNKLTTTIKSIIQANNAVTFPDGWNGGAVVKDAFGTDSLKVLRTLSADTIYNRQYAICPGSFTLTFSAKGTGTLVVRKILNKDQFNTYSGSSFTIIKSIPINSAGCYSNFSEMINLPEGNMEVYGPPLNLIDEAYQNYMKGYGNKICGIQIELVVSGGNPLSVGNFSLVKL